MIFYYEKRLLDLIAFRKGSFSKCENTKSILLPGALPPGPPTGRCPCTPLGASAAPRPLASGGVFDTTCHLLSIYLHLLKNFLTTLLFSTFNYITPDNFPANKKDRSRFPQTVVLHLLRLQSVI